MTSGPYFAHSWSTLCTDWFNKPPLSCMPPDRHLSQFVCYACCGECGPLHSRYHSPPPSLIFLMRLPRSHTPNPQLVGAQCLQMPKRENDQKFPHYPRDLGGKVLVHFAAEGCVTLLSKRGTTDLSSSPPLIQEVYSGGEGRKGVR